MHWAKRASLAFTLLFVIFVSGILFSLARFIRNPSLLQDPVTSEIEEALGVQLGFQDAKFVLTPLPGLRVRKLHLQSATEGLPDFTARQAWFHFRFLPLLRGRIELAGTQIREGEGTFWGVPLEHVQFKMRKLAADGTASFEWRANFLGGKENLQGKGQIFLKNPGENFWAGLGLKVDITMSTRLPLVKGVGESFSERFLREASGELGGQVHLEKQKGTYLIGGSSKFRVKDFQWTNSTPFSVNGETDFLWNLENGSVEFQRVPIQTPFGQLDGTGLYKVETGELEEVRIIGRKVVLDELARHFPNVNKFLPLDIGFSGESEFDLTIGGTWDFLSFHANWNLNSAVLTQGQLFSKPKDFPMQINFDFVLKEAEVLSGDFSSRIQEASIKGTLVDLNLKTGAGEVGLLTNKFELKGWEMLLVPFKGYQMSGLAKILLSSKGNFGELEKAKHMLNLTLENVNLVSPSGKGIREARVLLDSGPLGVKVQDSTFKLGNSLMVVDMELYHLDGKPQGIVSVISPHFDPFEALEHLKEFAPKFIPYAQTVPWNGIQETLSRFLPPAVPLEEMGLSLKIKDNHWTVQNFEFQALNGIFHFEGALEKLAEKYDFQLDSEINRMSLARYFEQKLQAEKVLEGNLFFKGRFEASAEKLEDLPKKIGGEGTLAITNGEWHSLDFVAPLNRLEPFEKLDLPETPSLSFYDLKTGWKYEEGKFETKDFLIHAQDLWMEGEGNLSVDGTVNARINLNFSKLLTEKAFSSWGFREEPQGKQLGPIPFLLVGSLKNPQPRLDDQRVIPLLEAIHSQALHRILREPFKGSS